MIEIKDSSSDNGQEEEETIISEQDHDYDYRKDEENEDDDEDHDHSSDGARDSDDIDIEKHLGYGVQQRWLSLQNVTEQEISWQRGLRFDGAVSDATQYGRRPVLFAVQSMYDKDHRGSGDYKDCKDCKDVHGTTRYYAWWPPHDNVSLGRDVLKTFYLTRTSLRYFVQSVNHSSNNNSNNSKTTAPQPRQHRQLVNAFLHILCPTYAPLSLITQYKQSVRNDSLRLLREYFGTIDLGRLRHVYHYADEEHCDESVCADELDDALPLFLWEC